MVASCRKCATCKEHNEQFCKSCIYTYNYKHADGTIEQGGYTTHIVVREASVSPSGWDGRCCKDAGSSKSSRPLAMYPVLSRSGSVPSALHCLKSAQPSSCACSPLTPQ